MNIYRLKIHQEIANKWFEETYKDFEKHVCYGPKQLEFKFDKLKELKKS